MSQEEYTTPPGFRVSGAGGAKLAPVLIDPAAPASEGDVITRVGAGYAPQAASGGGSGVVGFAGYTDNFTNLASGASVTPPVLTPTNRGDFLAGMTIDGDGKLVTTEAGTYEWSVLGYLDHDADSTPHTVKFDFNTDHTDYAVNGQFTPSLVGSSTPPTVFGGGLTTCTVGDHFYVVVTNGGAAAIGGYCYLSVRLVGAVPVGAVPL